MSTDTGSTRDPDEIRADIERTRAELSSDVDALGDKVSPGQVAHRQAEKVRSAASGLKDRVTGTVSDGAGSAGSAASSVGDATSSLPGNAMDRARGNPLAAGLIAFGAGWLVASLLPSTRREQDLAQTAKDQSGPLVGEVKNVAQDAAANLKAPAQDAVTAVKDKATDAASSVRDQGQSAAQDLKSQATGSDDDTHGAHVAEDPIGTPAPPQ